MNQKNHSSPPPPDSARQRLTKALDFIESAQPPNAKTISIGEILHAIDQGSSSVVLLILLVSVPTSIPAPPLGPEHMPFGIAHCVLVAQMLCRTFSSAHRPVWLPKFVTRIQVNLRAPKVAKTLRHMRQFVTKYASSSPPPAALAWVVGPVGEAAIGVCIVLMAVLMVVPIPFTNFLPSFMITLLSGAFLLQNVIMIAVAIGLTLATFAMYWHVFKWIIQKIADAWRRRKIKSK